MNEQTAQTSTELVIALPTELTVETFTKGDEFEQLFEKIKAVLDDFEPDLSTKAGRAEIASMAYKVSRTKAELVRQGKKLNDEARAQINSVNAACKAIEDRMDALRDKTREPLTNWEKEEERRIQTHRDRLSQMTLEPMALRDLSSEALRGKLDEIDAIKIDESWDEFTSAAGIAKQQAVDLLKEMIPAAEKREAEAAELERLRREKEERDREDAERRQREEAERQRAEAAAREQAEQERIEREARERADREAQRRIDEANREAAAAKEEAERRIREAEEKAARERKEREDAERAEREERERKAANAKHRATIITKATRAIMEAADIEQHQAGEIAQAIADGQIPHIRMEF